YVFFFSSRRRHTRSYGDWSSDVCSSDLKMASSATLTASHCSHKCSRVHRNGTPLRKPRNSGGSPSGVSRPPQLETMKMKKTTKRSEERRVGKEWRSRWGRSYE